MNAERSSSLVSLLSRSTDGACSSHAAAFARTALAVLAVAMLQPAGAVTLTSVTRDVAYTYDPTNGQVLTEQVDPGLDHCVETDYVLDSFGNRKQVTVKPCSTTSAAASFTARVTTNEFLASSNAANTTPPASGFSYPAGAYLTHSSSGTSSTTLAETRGAYDPRFGAASSQVSVARQDTTKNLVKRTEYDGLGRVYREYAPVKRNADNSVVESYVQYKYVSCYPTPSPGCYSFGTTVQVKYDSERLVDSAGKVTSSATVAFTSAYFVEATPFDLTGVQVGATSRVHYDALNREIVKESQAYDGSWIRTLTGYDQLGLQAVSYGPHTGRDTSGNPVSPTEEVKQWTVERDLEQRGIEQHHHWRPSDGADGSSTASELVAKLVFNGLETEAIVPASSTPEGADRVSYVRKSPLNHTVQTVNADGATLTTAFDPAGNLVNTVDALGNKSTITYTPGTARFKTAMSDPDMGAWSYVYDALGQFTQQTDARGTVTTMSYDPLGRLVNKSTPNFVSKWYYDQYSDGSYCAYGLSRLCYSQLGATTPVDSERLDYDTLGRAFRSTSTLDTAYVTETSFDSVGRPSTLKYPTGFTVKYAYSAAGSGRTPGVLQQVADNAAPTTRIFWRIDSVTANQVFDTHGNLKKAVLGNGITVDNLFDSISGKAFSLNAGSGGSTTNVFSQTYTWDKAGNLSTRADGLTAVSDAFAYDLLDRLTSDAITSTSDLGASRTTTVGYNAIGNILVKSDIGGYTYSATDKPHAVRAAGNTTYNYDSNGSISTTSGMQVRGNTWNDFNQPDRLTSGGGGVDFSYDADHKRVKEVFNQGGTTRTVYLVHPDNVGGLGYEREETSVGGAVTRNESRHYVSVWGSVVAVVKTLNGSGTVSSDATLTNYWHKDSLGSIAAVTTATGAVLERMAFDAWGRRITTVGRFDSNLNPTNGNRGYTGHEELDEVGLVHMNGRVYDPTLGRFLSSDSVIEAPDLLQNYNRYSYVLNNPLKFTDASGHCFEDACFFEVMMLVAGYELSQHGNENWRMAGSTLMAYAGSELVEAGLGQSMTAGNNISAQISAGGNPAFQVGTAGNAFASSFGVTMLTTNGNLEESAKAGLFAAAFSLAGTYTKAGTWEKFASHGLIGCVQSASSGGKCGPGAASAIVGEGASEMSGGLNPAMNGIVTTIAGGTASVIGGGKFSSGAYQAAFGYIFNYLWHNAAAGPYLDKLRAGSPQAASMLAALAADTTTTYYFNVGEVPDYVGGGMMTMVPGAQPSVWDRFIHGAKTPLPAILVTVTDRPSAEFTDVNGKKFMPDTLRLIAHELGHAFIWYQSGHDVGWSRMWYDKAVTYENIIAKQIKPGAPERAVSDHGANHP